ncbi:MAG: uracil-DNA glycosylase [Acholeplasmataceae bacterium]|nr:uracil-DNA glycosylase [Acholeplasmataceae bacterium]
MTWDKMIAAELKKPYFQDLIRFLKAEDARKTILPVKDNRMNAFKLTPFDEVKVVIIGQDPYHNLGQAHGLSFSVEQGPWPPSLKNIYKELHDDLGIKRETGNLSGWARQGVLLLNRVLTVEIHQPLSHQNHGWEMFTEEAVRLIAHKETPVVFILWGAHAQKVRPLINNPRHLVLTSVHPSPLSASRGFFGSKPFSKTNAYLEKEGLEPIDFAL